LATRQENKEEQTRMRAEIAQLTNRRYGTNYETTDITDCDGCTTEGERLFSGCKNCLIRRCAREKKVENCAYCAEYACVKLEAFFKIEPIAKTRSDAIRRSIRGAGAASRSATGF
jgi:hypothetical protein